MAALKIGVPRAPHRTWDRSLDTLGIYISWDRFWQESSYCSTLCSGILLKGSVSRNQASFFHADTGLVGRFMALAFKRKHYNHVLVKRNRCRQVELCKSHGDSGGTDSVEGRPGNQFENDEKELSCDRGVEGDAIGRYSESGGATLARAVSGDTINRRNLIQKENDKVLLKDAGRHDRTAAGVDEETVLNDNGSCGCESVDLLTHQPNKKESFRESTGEVEDNEINVERRRYDVRSSNVPETSVDGRKSVDVGNALLGTWGAHSAKESQCENVIPSQSSLFSVENVSLALKEPFYEVLEVNPSGDTVERKISRRQLLKSSGLRLRDIRSVDPSLWITNSMPALLIRDQAILLNLGSLRAIAMPESVLIFDHKSIGAQAFLEMLQPRITSENSGLPIMPFELEVVEAALMSRTTRLERRLMEVEPRVLSLLEVLPNRLTADVLEELRVSKQALVELGSKAGAQRQMLLELLEDPQEIRRMAVMGRRCIIRKDDGSVQCMDSSDKQLADDEAEEIEMLLENYLQRCESCHGQAERLLDSAKEMEDSIAVNLSSRRLEVSRLELLLQVGTFCSALGALIAGIFGMNLRSYLEESALAFWLTTGGIIMGGVILFFITYNYLKRRKIL